MMFSANPRVSERSPFCEYGQWYTPGHRDRRTFQNLCFVVLQLYLFAARVGVYDERASFEASNTTLGLNANCIVILGAFQLPVSSKIVVHCAPDSWSLKMNGPAREAGV